MGGRKAIDLTGKVYGDCNFSKRNRTEEDFFAWVSRLYKNLNKKGLVD